LSTLTWSKTTAPGVTPKEKYGRPSAPRAEAGSTPNVTRIGAFELVAADAGDTMHTSNTAHTRRPMGNSMAALGRNLSLCLPPLLDTGRGLSGKVFHELHPPDLVTLHYYWNRCNLSFISFLITYAKTLTRRADDWPAAVARSPRRRALSP
jgi:hypothetical protein